MVVLILTAVCGVFDEGLVFLDKDIDFIKRCVRVSVAGQLKMVSFPYFPRVKSFKQLEGSDLKASLGREL